MRADQSASADHSPVHNSTMADNDLLGDPHPIVIAYVDDSPILDVGTRTDFDSIDVPAKYAAVPNADLITELYITDDRRPRGYVHPFSKDWELVEIALDQRPRLTRAQLFEAFLQRS